MFRENIPIRIFCLVAYPVDVGCTIISTAKQVPSYFIGLAVATDTCSIFISQGNSKQFKNYCIHVYKTKPYNIDDYVISKCAISIRIKRSRPENVWFHAFPFIF